MPDARENGGSTRISIFLSYAREDRAIAERLYQDLGAHGLKPWIDFQDILPGQQWKVAIGDAIKESSLFIALLSANSVNKKGYVQRELRSALDTLDELTDDDIFLIPARLDDCKPSFRRLEEINWVDLFPSYENGLARILRAIEVHSNSAAKRSQFKEARLEDTPDNTQRLEEAEEKQDTEEEEDSYLSYLRDRFDSVDDISIEKADDAAYVGESKRYLKLTRSVLEYLAAREFRKVVIRGSLIEIPDNVAVLFASLKCRELTIETISNLTPRMAQSLVRWKGVYLSIVAETLPYQAVEALAAWQGSTLELGGIESLAGDIAQHLVRWRGESLRLAPLQHLPSEAASLLSKWPGRQLKLEGLLELTADAARQLAQWEGESLHLLKVNSLPIESAGCIAEWGGKYLDLTGVHKIQLAALERITRWQGETLILDHIGTLTSSRAQVISKWGGRHLHLADAGKLRTKSALLLYNWQGKVLTLDGTEASKGARFYLQQWGDVSGTFSKWGSATVERRNRPPSAPKHFGMLPTLLDVVKEDVPSHANSKGKRAKLAIREDLLKSKVYLDVIRASRKHASLSLLTLVVLSLLLVVAAQAGFMKTTFSFFHVGESLFHPRPSFLEGVLRIARLIGRVILSLIVPALLSLVALVAYMRTDGMFSKLPRDAARALESRYDKLFSLITWLGVGPITLYYVHLIFPSFFEIFEVDWRSAFVGTQRDVVDGFKSGVWHGFASPVRAIASGFPTHSKTNDGWLFYYPGYIAGGIIGAACMMRIPKLLLWVLMGFNSERYKIALRQLEERSHISLATKTSILACTCWVIALMVGIFL